MSINKETDGNQMTWDFGWVYGHFESKDYFENKYFLRNRKIVIY
jgi:hypothetical protein